MTKAAVLDLGSVTPNSPREIGLWSGAAMVVLAAHLLIAFGFRELQPVDRVDATEQALTIDLAPLPVTTPESVEAEGTAQETPREMLEPVQDAAEPVQETTETTEPAPKENALEPTPPENAAELTPEAQERPETVTPEQALPAENEPLAAEPEMRTAEIVAEPAPIEPTRVPETESRPTVEADVIEQTPPEIVEQVLPDVIAALPEAKPIASEPAPVAETPRADPPKKALRAKPARKPAPAPKAQAKPKATASSKASQKSLASKAPSVNPARWQSKVLAWINRHKRYPRGAKSRGEQGVAQVNFAVDSSGAVSSVSLARSSGNAELDRAAVDMVRRASPVPAPPQGLSAGRIRLALPVQFSLR